MSFQKKRREGVTFKEWLFKEEIRIKKVFTYRSINYYSFEL